MQEDPNFYELLDQDIKIRKKGLKKLTHSRMVPKSGLLGQTQHYTQSFFFLKILKNNKCSWYLDLCIPPINIARKSSMWASLEV